MPAGKTPGTVAAIVGAQGDLNGTPFFKISFDGSGVSKFVVKGFVDIKVGPVVKFSCAWGQLEDGRVFYLPAGKKNWIEPEVQSYKFTGNVLVLSFELPGEKKSSKNTAKIKVF